MSMKVLKAIVRNHSLYTRYHTMTKDITNSDIKVTNVPIYLPTDVTINRQKMSMTKKHGLIQIKPTAFKIKKIIPNTQKSPFLKKSSSERNKKIYKKTQMFVVDPNDFDGDSDGDVVNSNAVSNENDVDDIEVNDVAGDRKENVNKNADELIINDDGENAEYLTSTNDNDDIKDSESLESSKYDNAILTTQLSSSPTFVTSVNPTKQLQPTFVTSLNPTKQLQPNQRYFQISQVNPIQKVFPMSQMMAQQPQRQQIKPLVNRLPFAAPFIQLPAAQPKMNVPPQRLQLPTFLTNSAASNLIATTDNLNMGVNNNEGNILFGDSLKDGLSTPFIESNVMIQNNQMKGHYLPIHERKSLYKAQLPKQLEEGAQLGVIQSPLGFLTPKVGSFMPGDKSPIDKSILKAITEEVKKDNKFFISPNYEDNFKTYANNIPDRNIELNLTQISVDESAMKHSADGTRQDDANKELQANINQAGAIPQQNLMDQQTQQEQLQKNLYTPVSADKQNVYTPVSAEKQTEKLMNTLTDNIVTSQNNFFRYGQTLLKKNPPGSEGIDVEPSLTSLSPSEQHLISSIDKNVRKKLTQSINANKILLPTKADALSDRTVAPSEQLLDMLARGKFKDPLSDDVLNKLALFDPNQMYLNEAGLQPLAAKMPEKFAKIGSEYVPIHSIAVNLPRTTSKPFIDAKQMQKAEMLMKTNPAYIGQNQQLLDMDRFKTLQDLNNIGETIFPNHVVSVAEPKPIISPSEVASRKTDTLKYAQTTQDKIDLKEQQSTLSPSERKQAALLEHQHSNSNDAPVTIQNKKPPAYIQEIIQRQNQIDETLKSFEDALADSPRGLPPLPSSNDLVKNTNGKVNKDADANAQCKFNPCLNAGTCTAQPDGYRCSCKIGWIGMNCEKRSNCFPNPCHHGTCSPNIESYTCTCKLGYKGTHCDIIDRCIPNPCNNRGVCTETSKDVSCECTPGFKGKLCEQEAHCSPLNPCLNGGTCNEFYDHYQCNCPADFRGQNCEAYVTPTKSPPTMPIKHVEPQAIPPPELISDESKPVDVEAVNINRHSDEEHLPSFMSAVNSGGPLVPHPISNSEINKYISKQSLGSPVSSNDNFQIHKDAEETRENNTQSFEPQQDGRYQTHLTELQNSNSDQTFKSSTDEKRGDEQTSENTKQNEKRLDENKNFEVEVESKKDNSDKLPFVANDMSSIDTLAPSNDSQVSSESSKNLQKYSNTKYKISTDENTSSYSRDTKSDLSGEHEVISQYARLKPENKDAKDNREYLKLEEQHFKSSYEENPRFDYLHLHEAHGTPKSDANPAGYLKLDGMRNKNGQHDGDLTRDIRDPTNGPTLSSSRPATTRVSSYSATENDNLNFDKKASQHEIENKFISHEIKKKNLSTPKKVWTPEPPKFVSGSSRSDVHVLRYRTPGPKQRIAQSENSSPVTKVNINTIANEAQKQVDLTAASIQKAKENAIETNETLPQEDVDQMNMVEQKANQIYAGIKAGIKDPVPTAQEKNKADTVISNINTHIQEKMKQAKQINSFWERSFTNQKDAYSAWRKKALINFHNRNPTQPLPKNTVSLSKNSLCPGFCKLYCDPWCVKIGCCKTTDDQLALFENIEREHESHLVRKAWSPCDKCNENADCFNDKCFCKTGFHGNGQTCSINNCLLCHLDADCIGERCVCKNGFHGDGYECKKSIKGTTLPAYKRHLCPPCHSKAHCVSGYCQCKRGFFGNGKSCWPLPII